MKLLGWSGVLLMVVASVSSLAVASERHQHRYRIAEKSLTNVDKSPYTLVVTSEDLTKFPHSVVIFEVKTENSRAPSAVAPAENAVERLRAKRYFLRINDSEYGHRGEAQVVFNRKAHSVYIGFLGKTGRTFFYKELDDVSEPATTSQLGSLDTD
jgi:hypothetical protein